MAGPWEKYAAQGVSAPTGGKPWEKYGAAPQAAEQPYELSDIAKGAYEGIKNIASYTYNNPQEALSNVATYSGNVVRDIVTNPADAAMSAASGIARAVPQAIDMGGALVAKGGNILAQQAGLQDNVPFSEYAALRPLDSALTAVVGEEYQPQTQGGEAVKLGASFISPGAYAKGLKMAKVNEIPNLARKAADEFVQGATKGINEVPTAAAEIRANASQIYQQAREAGAVLKSESVNNLVDDIAKMQPQTEAGKIIAGKSAASDLVERVKNLRGMELDLDSMQEVDKILGDMAEEARDAVTGKYSPEGKKILEIQHKMRDKIKTDAEGSGVDIWKTANREWQRQAQMADIERILAKAETTDNPATSIRTAFGNIVSTPGRLNRFDAETQKAIRKAAETGVVTNVLRAGGSGLVPYVATAAGAVGGLPGAVISGVVGYGLQRGAKAGATALQKARYNNVVKAIAGGEDASLAKKAGDTVGKTLGIQAKTGAIAPDPRAKITRSPVQAPNPVAKPVQSAPAPTAAPKGPEPDDVIKFIQRSGGINWRNLTAEEMKTAGSHWNGREFLKRAGSDISDIWDGNRSLKAKLGRNNGMKPDRMVMALIEAKYLPEGATLDDAVKLLQRAARGEKIYSQADNLDALPAQLEKGQQRYYDNMNPDAEVPPPAKELTPQEKSDWEKLYGVPYGDIPFARPEATIAAVTLAGGLGAANFASSLATNTQYNPAIPALSDTRNFVPDNKPIPTEEEKQAYRAARLQREAQAAASQPAPQAEPQAAPQPEPQQMPANAVDPIEQYLDRKMQVESGGKADAKARTSSATGAFQYTVGRWLEMLPKAAPELVVGKNEKEILALRYDPEVSRRVARYDTENELAPALQRAGIPITSTTLYLAHFLGPTGARRLLTAKVGTPITQVIDAKSIKANPFLRQFKRAEDVLRWAQKKMEG